MAQDLVRHNRAVSHDLHPRVVTAVAGATIWFVLAAFAGFAVDGYTAYLLMFVAFVFLIALAIPYLLYRTWQNNHRADENAGIEPISFRDWAAGDFDIWQDRVKGTNAAAEVMIPIAAAAIGMTAIGIVFHLAA